MATQIGLRHEPRGLKICPTNSVLVDKGKLKSSYDVKGDFYEPLKLGLRGGGELGKIFTTDFMSS